MRFEEESFGICMFPTLPNVSCIMPPPPPPAPFPVNRQYFYGFRASVLFRTASDVGFYFI